MKKPIRYSSLLLFAFTLLLPGLTIAQDRIIKTDSTIIESQVIRIDQETIEYKKWNNLNGPVYSLNKRQVLQIVYENGTKDVFANTESNNQSFIPESDSINANSDNQKALLFTKMKNGKTKTIKQGRRIKVFTGNGEVLKGDYLIRNDSLVVIGKGKAGLDEIIAISKVPLGMRIAGGVITTVGGAGSVATTIGIVSALQQGGFAGLALIFLVPLEAITLTVTTAGVLMFVSGRKFKQNKWDISITTLNEAAQ